KLYMNLISLMILFKLVHVNSKNLSILVGTICIFYYTKQRRTDNRKDYVMTTDIAIEKPIFPEDVQEADLKHIQNEAMYEHCIFRDCTLTHETFDNLSLLYVLFINIQFDQFVFK